MAHFSSSRPNRMVFLSSETRAALQALLWRLAGIGLIAVAVLGLVAFSSYDSSDPSWNTASSEIPSNTLGMPGAVAADVFLQGFGLGVIALLLLVVGWGMRLWRNLPMPRAGYRLAMGFGSVLCFSACAAAFNHPFGWALPFSPGGGAGAFLLTHLHGLLNLVTGDALGGDPWLAGLLFVIPGLLAMKSALLMPRAVILSSGQAAASTLAQGFSGFQDILANVRNRLGGEDDNPYTPQTAKTAAPRKPRTARPKIAAGTAPVEEPAQATAVTAKKAARIARKFRPAERYMLPSLDLLAAVRKRGPSIDKKSLDERRGELSNVLSDFGVNGDVIGANPGPVVTLFELEPARGVKSARVITLADDIARSMSAVSARVAVVPGRNIIGIELPNPQRETVLLREILDHPTFATGKSKLPLALGKDIGGAPVVVDLAKMPHLLVAGTTGSGKSVSVNTMILSLLYCLTPEQCRFIMVDPKMLELSVYDGIPHLLSPVVTDPKKAVVALKWTVKEMENRYFSMSRLGVRNIEGYNQRIQQAIATGEVLSRRVQTGFDPETGKPVYEDQPLPLQPLPYIVVIVDEMADLMLVAGKDIEAAIQRLAQMARAAGIHIIMATQRPSVDVITGTIKANFPTRISFQVTSKIDSRTILGEQGAEQLLGQGDMLYMAGGGRISRIHGPFVSDKEVEDIVAHLKSQGAPDYVEDVTIETEDMAAGGEGGGDGGDAMYEQAVSIIRREGKVSTSFIQRHLQIGYNRAARIVELMEERGVISKPNHAGKREIL